MCVGSTDLDSGERGETETSMGGQGEKPQGRSTLKASRGVPSR